MSENTNTNSLKFIIPGILAAFIGYQMMQSKQAQTSSQPSSQTPVQQDPRTPSQPSSQTPVQQDPRNPSQPDRQTPIVQPNPQNIPQEFSLVGIWQAQGTLTNGSKFAAKINFQPDGTYQQELNTTTSPDGTYGATSGMTYGSYKRTGQNSLVLSAEKACTSGECVPDTKSVGFTIVSATELSSDGTKFRKISN